MSNETGFMPVHSGGMAVNMIIKQKCPFRQGYTPITLLDDRKTKTMMDFGILKLSQRQSFVSDEKKERAYLLIKGEVVFEYGDFSSKAKRYSFLDENPWCLHVPAGQQIKITGVGEDTEIAVTMTVNNKLFPPKLYTQEECRSERRGSGTMREASTRIVRTIFDKYNTEVSNLVIGEVIDYPGKWSSYPPHHHVQPEIYFYKFHPGQGFGYAELGEEVHKVRNNDTVLIVNDETHPQATAPGYAMYYIWVIRHLDENPYINPVFAPEHLWVQEKDAAIWP